MSRQRDREEFVSIMAREAPSVPLHVVQALMRAETTLHRFAEAECNGDDWRDGKGPRHLLIKGNPKGQVTACGEALTTPENIPAKLRTTFKSSQATCTPCRGWNIERRLERMVEPYGIGLHFNGDPRGPAILVGVPSGFTNDWGKRGICVP